MLTQNSSGVRSHFSYNGNSANPEIRRQHGSISAPSLCTIEHIRAYFTDGKLPEEGTICEVSEPIFKPSSSSSNGNQGEEEKMFTFTESGDSDVQLREAVQALSRDTGITYGIHW